ncbi:MAG: hypothetical protein H6700_02905 [Myxococcales bacterium]|nr:hypothetical protein [Myxococcales bacterium]MCB9530690.1 hypothetical protein [Myxococcales bacterium]
MLRHPHRAAAALFVILAACSGSEDIVVFDSGAAVQDGGSAICAAGATQLCACSTGQTGAQVCEADGSAWADCSCTEPPSVGGVTISVTDGAGQPTVAIDDVHVVGTTDCLQPLGSLFLDNGSDASAEITFATLEALPQVVFTPTSPITLDAGASETVAIQFNCELLPGWPPVDIDTAVNVAGGDAEIEFPLGLTFENVDQPPGAVTFALTDKDGQAATAIDEVHDVGTTDCLQPLGTVTVTNDTDAAADITVGTADELPQIVFTPESPFPVAAGASQAVAIHFNCELLPGWPPIDVATTVNVAGGDATFDFALGLTFENVTP